MSFLNGLKGLSFQTINSVGANVGITHYAAKEDSCAELQPDSMYLSDSGS
jgi:Xaa-Pro aminopeptidase